MATLKQKKAKEILDKGECKTMKEVMKKAGYSESIADKPKQKLVDSKGFLELEKAENAKDDQYYSSFDLKHSTKGMLRWLYEHRESLDNKEKMMLAKLSNEIMKSNPELFKEQGTTLEDTIQRLRARMDRKENNG